MYWCNSNGSASAVLETRVSSYLSVAGEATPRGGHKDPERVVPPARVGGGATALEEGGVGSAGCQNCRLNMTRAPQVKLRDCNSPPRGPSRSAPRLAHLIEILTHTRARAHKAEASDSGTRPIILDMASPCSLDPRVTTLPPLPGLLLDLSTNMWWKLCGVAQHPPSIALFFPSPARRALNREDAEFSSFLTFPYLLPFLPFFPVGVFPPIKSPSSRT